ncbi:(2Fe-2S)-binding protein [Pseudoxanthobacter sp.]|uniref:(2Fe-2S)-binding protein n=1 Tax=Pseudoxanthobacter sp. TaxID=1925742 RepID=UPI002FE00E6E
MPVTFRRLGETHRPSLTIFCDSQPVEALEGDTVLSALLAHGGFLRVSEFLHRPRAGFCLMGACNDCVVWTADGSKLVACQTAVTPGLQVFTRLPEASWPPLIS